MTKSTSNQNIESAVRLDTLLKDRFHGAANIGGIRYQILYTLLVAIRLYRDDLSPWSLDLEGIEDVDLHGIRTGLRYVQVKSAQHPWNWARMKDPLRSFLQTLRSSPDSTLVLAVNFGLRGDIERLSRISKITGKESKRLKTKFRSLCADVGATTNEADHLLSRLQITSQPEPEVWHSMRQHVTESFGLVSEAADIYIQVLVSRFLDWAQQRKRVTRADMDIVRVQVGEALSRESSFQAYGLGLVGRLCWGEADFGLGFFEGKGARPEHIAAGLDVARSVWSEKIGESLNRFRMCVIRASSGQGKSVLMYRYARDHWPEENTFVLRTAQTPHDLQLIKDYLRFRASLFPSLRLLIDNAGWQTPLWAEVAQEVVSLGGQAIVSIRQEDWYRFARESSLSYGLIEPYLDLSEARRIFQAFKEHNRIHPDVSSAEWAYERVSEPHLLIEYVYLITQGRMLEERLRDQVKDFLMLGEDPAKLEILRRVSVASVFGAPLLVERLVNELQPSGDIQQILQSLAGEYIEFEGGYARGLHWVRSDHLVSILHECHPSVTVTATKALPAVPRESLSAFLAGAISSPSVDSCRLLAALAENLGGATVDLLVTCLDGIFTGGERLLFAKNKHLFEEAFQHLGSAGPFLLSTHFMLFGKANIIDQMAEISEGERTGFTVLQEIATKAQLTDRGFDYCAKFLQLITAHVASDTLIQSLSSTGRLLDWCAVAGADLPAWEEAKLRMFSPNPSIVPIDDLCAFAQGFYRYDQSSYLAWFEQNRESILGNLKLELDCISLEVDTDASISFLLDPEGETKPHEQTLTRLEFLRRALPFCQHYRSRGIWALPFGLQPHVDETVKGIPQENFPFPSDVAKNVIWRVIVETEFAADTHYRYQEHWYQLRSQALAFIGAFTKWLKLRFVGRLVSDDNAVAKANEVNRLISELPDPPAQMPIQLSQPIKTDAGGWATHLQNFVVQVCGEPDAVRLAVFNFREATRLLPRMQEAMAGMLIVCPDHFGMAGLEDREKAEYLHLEELADVIEEPPTTPQSDILRYVRALRAKNDRALTQLVERAVEPLADLGVRVNVATRLHVEHPLRHYPLMFTVMDPAYPELTLALVCAALAEPAKLAEGRVDLFYLIPVHSGARIFDGGYRLSPDKIQMISRDEAPNWESLVPIEIPEGVLALLPDMPVRPPVVFQLRLSLQGLYTHLDVLRQIEKLIEPLERSGNHYDSELYARWRVKLDRLRKEVPRAAEDLTLFVQSHFGNSATGPECEHLNQSILSIQDAFADNASADSAISASGLTLEHIADLVNALSPHADGSEVSEQLHPLY